MAIADEGGKRGRKRRAVGEGGGGGGRTRKTRKKKKKKRTKSEDAEESERKSHGQKTEWHEHEGAREAICLVWSVVSGLLVARRLCVFFLFFLSLYPSFFLSFFHVALGKSSWLLALLSQPPQQAPTLCS